MITLVSATQHSSATFYTETALGLSLSRLGGITDQWSISIVFDNTSDGRRGLSQIYNEALNESAEDQPLVLIHDDVSIQDCFLMEKLILAFNRFDVVGVAGGDPPDSLWGGRLVRRMEAVRLRSP
jgi:hypothetical protein